jgi:hypothetical protein
MMREFLLSWVTGRAGKRVGGTLPNPSWSDIERRLETANAETGSITLEVVNVGEIGPQSLQVSCESGEFMLMLGELVEDDYDVRVFTNADPKPDSGLILGDLWDPGSVCSDLTVVKRAFREFFETGDVSRDLLA